MTLDQFTQRLRDEVVALQRKPLERFIVAAQPLGYVEVTPALLQAQREDMAIALYNHKHGGV